ncbi:MAG TPA: nucleoside deaminase, partial [Gemmatimonadaceae bacterium]
EGVESVRALRDIAGHAELIAVREACRTLGTFDLSACTLYTTAEPCWMCSFAIRQTHTGSVIIGRPTPHIGGATSAHPTLSDAAVPGWGAPPQIVFGVLEAECLALGAHRPKPA